MKKAITTLILATMVFACSKDDAPKSVNVLGTKVIDKIEILHTNVNYSPENYTTFYEYNTNKEISKISLFRNGGFNVSYEYTYQNNIPISSQFVNQHQNSDAYNLVYNYANGIFTSTFYPPSNYYDTYSFDTQLNEYNNAVYDLTFRINSNDDINYKKNIDGENMSYTFEGSKKGPFYNVVNKKWIALLWFITDANRISDHVATTIPVTSCTIDNTIINYTNTYDAAGFVKTSSFSAPNGTYTIEIIFTYKLI